MTVIITDSDRPQVFGLAGFVWGLILNGLGGGPMFSIPGAVVSSTLLRFIWGLSSGSQQEKQTLMRRVECGMVAGIIAQTMFQSSSPDTPAPSPTSRI